MKVTLANTSKHFRTVTFDPATNEVLLIEQRLLPHSFEIIRTKDFNETARAIRDMVVRGAGAIGAAAAYGFAQGIRSYQANEDSFEAHASLVYETLKEARPTAVDPVNAMNQIQGKMAAGKTVSEKKEIALRAAEAFAEEDVQHCREIGEQGVSLIEEG